MSAPRFIECKCGHAKRDHETEGFAPQCTASGCTCLQYRAKTAPGIGPINPVPAPTAAPTIEQLIAAAGRTGVAKIERLADRIGTLSNDLRLALKDHRDQAAARAKVAELQRELAEAKAALRGQTGDDKPKATGDGVCPDCGKDGLANVGVHRSKAHGYKRAVAS